MAKEGLCILACAGALLVISASAPVMAADRDNSVADTLAVQTALQQGREYLVRNNARAAVETLERQLPRINGNAAYLALLRDAYRAYIKELQLNHQDALAQHYAQLLAIVEPSPAGGMASRGQAAPAPTKPALSEAEAPAKPPVAVAGTPTPATGKPATFRLKREDDDFFKASAVTKQKSALDLLKQAEAAFSQSKYREASQYFDQAYQTDSLSTNASGEKWAYCKLHQVVDQLNQQSTAYPALEKEVRSALSMQISGRIETFGKQLLAEIDKRRQLPAKETSNTVAVTLKNLGRNAEGWSVAETANFRIYHTQSTDYVEQAARVAEETRAAMHAKWFGGTPAPWNPKCELFLYGTGKDYSRATRVPPSSPGHSSFQLDGGRVLSRRIDLHCDNLDLLTAVLPHETTHVVLAGNFGEQPVPRWADEGIAVLTEPRPKIERHLRNLAQHRQEGQLFHLRQLVQMNDYPQPQQIPAFYAQSVSLVDFLSHEKGPQVFCQFVRDGLRSGYDSALQRHYGYRSFEELESQWSAVAFRDAASLGVALGSR
jgi:hypothetical protein